MMVNCPLTHRVTVVMVTSHHTTCINWLKFDQSINNDYNRENDQDSVQYAMKIQII